MTDYLESNPWAHVGMIIKAKNNKTYLWESTIKSNSKDVIDHETKDFSSDSHKLKFLQQETTLSKEHYFKPVLVNGKLSVRVTSD